MSPELLQFSTYNSKNDIWSAGVCLFEMSTGQPVVEKTNMSGHREFV